MVEEFASTATLDCSGRPCPTPVIRTAKAIKDIEVGQVLKMIASDPGSPADVAAWARQTGNELLATREADGKFVFYLRRLH